MSNWTIPFQVDLAKGAPFLQQAPQGLMLPNDCEAHTIRVTVLDNGAPATLSGTPMGYFKRKDGLTVPCEGTIDGNVISVTMDELCYLKGPLRCVIRILSDVENELGMSLVDAEFYVREGTGDSIVDPEDVFPSVHEQALEIAALDQRVNALEDPTVLVHEFTLENGTLLSPWQTYGGSDVERNILRVTRKGSIVFLTGKIANTSEITVAALSNNFKLVANLPDWAMPGKRIYTVGQGSGRAIFLIAAFPADYPSDETPANAAGTLQISKYRVGADFYVMAAGTDIFMNACWLAADATGDESDELEALVARMEAVAAGSVRYDSAQALTTAQKAQARTNIEAAKVAEDTSGLIINL